MTFDHLINSTVHTAEHGFMEIFFFFEIIYKNIYKQIVNVYVDFNFMGDKNCINFHNMRGFCPFPLGLGLNVL